MAEQHRATPEQWELLKRRVRLEVLEDEDAPFLLELLARVEALEARVSGLLLDIMAMVRGTASAEAKPAPAGSLVERVEARAGGDGRAAILEVSAHIRANFSSGPSVAAGIALWLEQEADRSTSQED